MPEPIPHDKRRRRLKNSNRQEISPGRSDAARRRGAGRLASVLRWQMAAAGFVGDWVRAEDG